MSVPIKIECECGQHYAFDVEPVNGRVPAPVACPACGADGTATANAILAQRLQTQATPSGAGPGPLRVSLAPDAGAAAGASGPTRAAVRPSAALVPGQTTRTQAEYEARAKVLWGDPPLQVLAYLMTQGFSREEAAEVVGEFVRERKRTIRLKAIQLICIGAVMVGLSAVSGFFYITSGHLSRGRGIGLLVLVGLVGLGLLLKGIALLVSPQSKDGDASQSGDVESLFD